MAAQVESSLKVSPGEAVKPMAGVGRPAAVVIPMPRLTADGHPMIDHAAGGRLGPARGILFGIGVGLVLWAGLLSLAWRVFH